MARSDVLELAFRNAAEADVAGSALEWPGFRLERVTLESDAAYDFRSEGHQHYLALHDIVLTDGELHIAGLPNIVRGDLRDTLTFAPRGCSIVGWAQPVARRNSYTALYFDIDAVREDLQEIYARNDAAPFAYSTEPGLLATMRKLSAITGADQMDRLHAEALGLAAMLEVLKVPRIPPAGQLSAKQLQTIRDYIEENISGSIGLGDLAHCVRLSRFHFSRAFKASTGSNPHEFVNSRRIERAKSLLKAAPAEQIDAVARTVGFASGAVFRRSFKRVTGVSPQTYRSNIS